MKTKLVLFIIYCIPALLLAQGNMVSGENPEDIEIIKEDNIHPFDTTQAFVLGMQSTLHYYYTLQATNPQIGYTTFFEIYTDAQIAAQDFITNPIRLPNIRFRSTEQYYGSFLLLLYNEAHQRANDETRHEYERHLEAAVLYRAAYLAGEEYIEEDEDTNDTEDSEIPFLLEQLHTQAFAEERYLADLINPERHLNEDPYTLLVPPNTPVELSEEDFEDLPELEPYTVNEDTELDKILEEIELINPYVTWPPNDEGIRSLIREGLILSTSAEHFML